MVHGRSKSQFFKRDHFLINLGTCAHIPKARFAALRTSPKAYDKRVQDEESEEESEREFEEHRISNQDQTS